LAIYDRDNNIADCLNRAHGTNVNYKIENNVLKIKISFVQEKYFYSSYSGSGGDFRLEKKCYGHDPMTVYIGLLAQTFASYKTSNEIKLKRILKEFQLKNLPID